jgi:outer membrane receptor protein involved in Fe transport
MNRLVHSSVAAFLASAAVAHAQQPPASPPPPPPPAAAAEEDEESNDDIVVLANPGDQVRIDRRTYTLRDDAAAQSSNMFDVLGKIPSVSVSPAGDVTLLGASGVIIQINGQPVPGVNLEQVLRGLQGSEVERIEVITNPSAQYSAQASGGIINIITRRRFNAGFNGSIQASVEYPEGYHFGIGPSYSVGPWTFSGQIGTYGGGRENDLTREREDTPGGAITSEEGARDIEWNGIYLSRLQIAYAPTDKRRMSLALDGGHHNTNINQSSALSDIGGPLLSTEANSENTFDNAQLTFDFQQTGDTPRELIKFNAVLNQFINESNSVFANIPAGGGPTNSYATSYENETNGLSSKLDVEQPMPSEQFLTFGGSYDYSDQTFQNSLTPLTGVTPPGYAAALDGTSQTIAGYVTYQFDIGDWTILPGLRAEGYWREITSGGLTTEDDDTRLFPSIHVRNELTRNINLDLSYTSRISRPGFQQLDPALRFFDVGRAFSGNPNLDPTTTDAYEANFVYQRNGASFSVTFFDRISEDIVSNFTELTPGGVILSMPVNAGESEQRGLQALLRGPIGDRWRYSLSGNVLSREYDFLSGGVISRRDDVEYDGVAQLDYRDPDQDAIGANQYQFEVRFVGPRHGLQTEIDPFYMANFTWRRRLGPKLFGVFMVQDIFNSTDQVTEVITDDYIEHAEFESAGTRFRIALTYQFGSGPQRPPSDQQPGPPPIPGGT